MSLFHDEVYNSKITSKIPSKPCDIIHLTKEGVDTLTELWVSSRSDCVVGEGYLVPSDLFFAGTIPLTDCTIRIAGDREIGEKESMIYRVVIFDNYSEILADTPQGEEATVGLAIVMYEIKDVGEIIAPIKVKYGFSFMLSDDKLYWRKVNKMQRERMSGRFGIEDILPINAMAIRAWYGVQIALLHPVIKEVFRTPRTTPLKQPRKSKKRTKTKAKVRYIKNHTINTGELNDLLYRESQSRGFNRKTLVWYVIGHWRKQRTGKTIFIKPYWKGALRATKTAAGQREREIAQIQQGGTVWKDLL